MDESQILTIPVGDIDRFGEPVGVVVADGKPVFLVNETRSNGCPIPSDLLPIIERWLLQHDAVNNGDATQALSDGVL